MLELLILDKSAESRNKIRNRLCDFIYAGSQSADIIPRISVKSISIEELSFQKSPKLILLGSEILSEDRGIISDIKTLFPNIIIIAWIDESLNKLFIIEELARLGVTDIFLDNITSNDFFRKLIILVRKTNKKQNSKIIVVDSGKGGSGVTSIVSALGEIYLDKGKKVLLVDCDIESQDLSRFLQVRPFINESLGLILDGLKPITQDSLKECYFNVWDDEENLYCMTPTVEVENIYSIKSSYYKNFLSVLENLDTYFDYIIIDLACFKGVLKTSLYRVCDVLLVIINNDPASIFANLELIKNAKNYLSSDAKLYIVENRHERTLISSDILKNEVLTSSLLLEDAFFPYAINYVPSHGRWPGSGATFYSQADKRLKDILFALSEKIDNRKYEISKIGIKEIILGYIKKIATIFSSFIDTYKNSKEDKRSKMLEDKNLEKIAEPKKTIDYKAQKYDIKEDEEKREKREEKEEKKFFTKAV
ncbi:MAG: AAA family ATPase [Bdellovibrionota bacterium]